MTALFRWLDVDYLQWRVLLVTSLKVDFEALRTKYRMRARRESGQLLELIVVCMLYVFSGISPAWFAFINPDPLFGATLLATIVAFMVMSTLLIGEGVAIASPDDYLVLGHRPVTSRTYFAVRIASLMVRTVIICTLISLGTIGVVAFRHGFHPERAAGVLLTSYLTGVAVTLTIVALYGWVLRLAGPARVMRWSSYMQFLAQTITLVGFMVATQEMGKNTIAGITMTGTLWVWAFPGAWFGAWVPIATGMFSTSTLVPAMLSLVTIAVIARSIGGKLALGYADSVSGAQTTAASHGDTPAAREWMRWLTSETRAVAILVRSHFRYDMKFRLGIISLIPVTLLYMWMGGWPQDPMAPRSLEDLINAGMDAGTAARKANGEFLVIMALLFLPLSLRRIINMSQNYRASWIYHVTPSVAAKIVMSARSVITVFFLGPYLAMVGIVYIIAFGNPAHALIHTGFMGLLAFNALQLTIAADPQLPFSTPAQRDVEGPMAVVTMLVSMVFGVGLYFLLTKVVYRSTLWMVVAALALIGLAYLMDRLTRWRAAKRLAGVGYVG